MKKQLLLMLAGVLVAGAVSADIIVFANRNDEPFYGDGSATWAIRDTVAGSVKMAGGGTWSLYTPDGLGTVVTNGLTDQWKTYHPTNTTATMTMEGYVSMQIHSITTNGVISAPGANNGGFAPDGSSWDPGEAAVISFDQALTLNDIFFHNFGTDEAFQLTSSAGTVIVTNVAMSTGDSYSFNLALAADEQVVMTGLTGNYVMKAIVVDVAAVPEPATMGLFGLSALGLWFARRMQRS